MVIFLTDPTRQVRRLAGQKLSHSTKEIQHSKSHTSQRVCFTFNKRTNVLAIQVGRSAKCDKKLATIGIGARIGTAQTTPGCMAVDEVLVWKFSTVDGLPSNPAPVREVPSLRHEPLDDAVKWAALVVQLLPGARRSTFTCGRQQTMQGLSCQPAARPRKQTTRRYP